MALAFYEGLVAPVGKHFPIESFDSCQGKKMALNPATLAAQLSAMTTESKSQEALTLEFAAAIANHIKTATVEAL